MVDLKLCPMREYTPRRVQTITPDLCAEQTCRHVDESRVKLLLLP